VYIDTLVVYIHGYPIYSQKLTEHVACLPKAAKSLYTIVELIEAPGEWDIFRCVY